MAEVPVKAGAGAAAGKAGDLIHKKIGPLPLWAWALAAGAAGIALKAVKGGGAPVTTTTRGTAAASGVPAIAGSSGSGFTPPEGPPPAAVMPSGQPLVAPPPVARIGRSRLPWDVFPGFGSADPPKGPIVNPGAPVSALPTPFPTPSSGAPIVVPTLPPGDASVIRVASPGQFAGLPGGAIFELINGQPISLDQSQIDRGGSVVTRKVTATVPPNTTVRAADVALPTGPTVKSSGVGAVPLKVSDAAGTIWNLTTGPGTGNALVAQPGSNPVNNRPGGGYVLSAEQEANARDLWDTQHETGFTGG